MNTEAYVDIEDMHNVDDKDSRYIKGATGLAGSGGGGSFTQTRN
jgi:hypothetical protein